MTKEHKHASLDLREMARRVMAENGFEAAMPSGAASELQALESKRHDAPADQSVRDLRSLLWSSIDNSDSRDLDQVEYAEQLEGDRIRLMIGIADVDAFVPKGSAIDRHAFHNTTSIYTGVKTFPMLPEQLSNETTSLLEDVDRLAVVIDMTIDPEGEVNLNDVFGAVLRNRAKLVYETLGAWLEGRAPAPPRVSDVAGLADQIHLQDEARERLRALRQRNGALNLQTIEAKPVAVDGRVVDLVQAEHNRARDIIESFMVAANTEMAEFLEAQGWPSIRRVVRTPERWPRIAEIARGFGDNLPEEPDSRALAAFLSRRKAADPEHFPDLSLSVVKLMGPGEYTVERAGAEGEGHFGLAVHDYTHSTAPNRRYADLITQRLVKAVIAHHAPPYTVAELREIAERCTEREDAARKVERLMRKAAAAVLLGERIGESFDAIVTGVSAKGTFVRLISPPADGRVVRGEEGMDVGDKVRVRLLSTEPERGFIDFARAS
jgi:VacB/RNase II family 3'-5' exoribonuclease